MRMKFKIMYRDNVALHALTFKKSSFLISVICSPVWESNLSITLMRLAEISKAKIFLKK